MASLKQREELMEQANSPLELKTQGDGEGFALSHDHKQYLLQRHGTLDLDPVPQPDDADPYNWPQRKASPCPKLGPPELPG
ncbi:major facilitator superfamily domain-containing protein [Penicillium sp. IBT 18751x]|nr:major facilitator superfamily domain-containing protein [Penicillium sp. IBT 18751x]